MSHPSPTKARGTTGEAEHAGLFIGSWKAGLQVPGAPTLWMDLMFNAVSRAVSGAGLITQAVNPSVPVYTHLVGDYTDISDQHHLVVLTGYPVPPNGSVVEPNAYVRMLLNSDWRSGTATFSYRTGDVWHTIEGVPVEKADIPAQAGL